jgi:uncharacterized membrane protein
LQGSNQKGEKQTVNTYKYNAGDAAKFSEKYLQSNGDRCIECGKAVGENSYLVEVINGGDLRAQDGTEAVHDAGYMAFYPVGSTCKNKFNPELLVTASYEPIAI